MKIILFLLFIIFVSSGRPIKCEPDDWEYRTEERLKWLEECKVKDQDEFIKLPIIEQAKFVDPVIARYLPTPCFEDEILSFWKSQQHLIVDQCVIGSIAFAAIYSKRNKQEWIHHHKRMITINVYKSMIDQNGVPAYL